MAAKKAQMFVVTAVFLTGLLFAVQEAMLTYAYIDMSGIFKSRENYMLMNLIDGINESARGPDDDISGCHEFEKNLKELILLAGSDINMQGYHIEVYYDLNCSYWNNTYPGKAPLRLTMIFIGTYDASGTLQFYHNQYTGCSDPVDGGKNENVKGTCYDNRHPEGISDRCYPTVPGNKLREYSCKNNKCILSEIKCPSGCSNGACF